MHRLMKQGISHILKDSTYPNLRVWTEDVDQYQLLMDAQTNNQIGFCPWTFYPSDMRVYMNENVDSMFLGVLSVDDFMNKSQEYLDAALASGTAPVLPE